MATITVRNLPEDVRRALEVRAKQNGRSTEAEVRVILTTATHPAGRLKLGSLLADIAREAGGLTDEELQAMNQSRSKG